MNDAASPPMTQVVVEVALPSEHQSVAGVVEYRDKLAQAATELGWPTPHTSDTKVQLAGGVPVNIALTREKLPVGVALFWKVDDDPEAIHRVLATISRWFDISYMTVGGALIAADHPEILAAPTEHEKDTADAV